MPSHLLLVTLGPVQDFIAQARRTRDLWYGSHLLSELGRAAARALTDGGATLIFPELPARDIELEPCLAPLRADGTPPRSIANKLLAEVPGDVDPEKLARAVRDAVFRYWRDDLAAPVKEMCGGLLAPGTDSVWAEQVETFIEFTAGWLPLDDYAETRRQLERAVAGRKLLRDFPAWTHGRGSVPKSSLDGGRETVLRPPREREARLVRKYRIADGEQLDAIGLVKRAGGKPEQFVPVVNVALASWVEFASRVAGDELQHLRTACEALGVAPVVRHDLPCVHLFPFDASVLLPGRWRAVFEEQGLESDAKAWGRRYVQPILSKVSAPYPYLACLVADGDRMGRALDQLASARDHRSFSEAVAAFARQARWVVEQEHRGTLVYAGGDDLLAFVPLPEALACANDLRKHFSAVMLSMCPSLANAEPPTLSVGLGIGHVMENMGDLLALGRRAEGEAKRDRNALAIIVNKRSGDERSWRGSWDDDPVAVLSQAGALLRDRLSSRKVYEIGRTLASLPEPSAVSDADWARVLRLDVGRSLTRIEDTGLSPADVALAVGDKDTYETSFWHVREWVNRMLIARTFARALPRERCGGGEAHP